MDDGDPPSLSVPVCDSLAQRPRRKGDARPRTALLYDLLQQLAVLRPLPVPPLVEATTQLFLAHPFDWTT